MGVGKWGWDTADGKKWVDKQIYVTFPFKTSKIKTHLRKKTGQKWVFHVRVAPFLTKLPKNNITVNLIPMIISV